ncbi:MAG: hypothetical protein Q4A00_04390 [Flavobacteriaceae bacterium]|nr:hypothetical protein [Flavobacteriaceae bacterium]
MKSKFLFQVIFLAVFSLLMFSCRYDIHVYNEIPVEGRLPVYSSDYDKEKGHDNWAKVEVIIRQGHLHGKNFHGNPELDIPILPMVQKVIFEQTPQGVKRTIDKGKSKRKDDDAIEVIASSEEGTRYAMEIIYYNSAGERINYQYLTPEQLPIHQHFFTVDKYTNFKTGRVFTAPKLEFFAHLYTYEYRDTNPDDQMFDRKNPNVKLLGSPVGLKGYFLFKKELKQTRFNMVVRLNHFKQNKMGANGKFEDANNPSRRARRQSVTDFYQKIPFVVVGYDGLTREETDQYFKDLAEYYGISEDDVEDYILGGDIDPESGGFWM